MVAMVQEYLGKNKIIPEAIFELISGASLEGGGVLIQHSDVLQFPPSKRRWKNVKSQTNCLR